MTTKELLVEHPLATKTVKEWLYKRMMETMDQTTVDPDFKEMMFSDALNDDRVSIIIDAQPSALFDMFDEHDIFISTHKISKGIFQYKVESFATSESYLMRKHAERAILEIAFSYLEQKLQLVELPNLES